MQQKPGGKGFHGCDGNTLLLAYAIEACTNRVKTLRALLQILWSELNFHPGRRNKVVSWIYAQHHTVEHAALCHFERYAGMMRTDANTLDHALLLQFLRIGEDWSIENGVKVMLVVNHMKHSEFNMIRF